jgi:hypothetical protein
MIEIRVTGPLVQIVVQDLIDNGNKVWVLVSFHSLYVFNVILMRPQVAENGTFVDGNAFHAEFVFMTELAEENGVWKIIETKEFLDSATIKDVYNRYHK